MQQDERFRRARTWVNSSGWFVVILSGLDLAGWWLHLPILTSLLPHYATMKPNTALCLGLIACAVLLSGRPSKRSSARHILARVSAGLSGLVSGLTLLEYLTGHSFGIDQLLYRVPPDSFLDPAGRMASGTAVSLLLTASALLAIDLLPTISTGLTLLSLVISSSALVGYVLQAGPLMDVVGLRSLAVHTASALLLLQLAILGLRPNRQPFAGLAQYHRREGRRGPLLFAVLLLPVLLALPITGGLHVGLYDARFALALLVVLLTGVQTFILWSDTIALGRVEDKLREREAESSRILHSIGDAVIVTDTESHVLRMNPLAEELTGWLLAEAAGKPLQEVFPISSELTGEPCESPVEKVRRLGTVVGLANHTVLQHRDGHTTHIDDSSAPIRDDDGQLKGIVLVFRDVNERKTAEGLLRSSENKLLVALSAARLGSWEVDLLTMQMECSAICKENFGRSANDRFGYKDLLASIHPEDLPMMEAAVAAAIQEQKVYRAEYRAFWPDGSLHWIIASGQVILSPLGDPQRMVGVTLDVTERHQTAMALLQNEKLAAVGRLSASIAHEINNPLESVTNLLYLVRTNSESEDVKEYIAIAERELQRAAAITSQTLRFHKQSTSPRLITSEELVSGVLTIYQGKIMNAGVAVETRFSTKDPLLCFEGEIRQVLSNLIGNAIDAMGSEGGRLVLRSREGTDARSGDRGLVITVADTGGGMSATTLQRIFEPFYTTKGHAGTGLGLWISLEIVQRHGGRLLVRSSQRLGKSGTVFMTFLPRRSELGLSPV